jgi:Ca2+-binding RTX toxin-like protein
MRPSPNSRKLAKTYSHKKTTLLKGLSPRTSLVFDQLEDRLAPAVNVTQAGGLLTIAQSGAVTDNVVVGQDNGGLTRVVVNGTAVGFGGGYTGVGVTSVTYSTSSGNGQSVTMSPNGTVGGIFLTPFTGSGQLTGGSGPDTITGGSGNDVIDGGTGADVLDGAAGTNTITAEGGSFNLTPTTLDNGTTISSLANFQKASLTGSGAADVISAATFNGPVTILGMGGDDSITGSQSNCSLVGGAGNVTIKGGAGNDTISGGQGNYTIDGGGGTNTIAETFTAGSVTITDSSMTGRGNYSLSNIQRADLTGTNATGTNFDISGFTGPITLTGSPGTTGNQVTATNDGTLTLTNTSLTRTLASITTLINIQNVSLAGSTGTSTFDVSGYNVAGSTVTLTGTGGNDTVTATNDADFTLNSAAGSLVRGPTTFNLSGITNAVLTGGAGGNTFDLSNWTGTATIDGQAGADTLIAPNLNNQTFQVTGVGSKVNFGASGNTGTILGTPSSFVNIETLTAAASPNTAVFSYAGYGKPVSFNRQTGVVTVDYGNLTISNPAVINTLVGNNSTSLVGRNAGDTYQMISGFTSTAAKANDGAGTTSPPFASWQSAHQGTIATFSQTGQNAGIVTTGPAFAFMGVSHIDGGTGTDTLDLSLFNNVSVNLDTGAVTTFTTGVSGTTSANGQFVNGAYGGGSFVLTGGIGVGTFESIIGATQNFAGSAASAATTSGTFSPATTPPTLSTTAVSGINAYPPTTRIVGPNADAVWTISAADTVGADGQVVSGGKTVTFKNANNLVGQSGADTFNVTTTAAGYSAPPANSGPTATPANYAGVYTFTGGGGTNTVDFSSTNTSRNVVLAAAFPLPGFSGVTSFGQINYVKAGSGADTLSVGTTTAATWFINGISAGPDVGSAVGAVVAGGVWNFEGFNTINGSSGTDVLSYGSFSPPAVPPGSPPATPIPIVVSIASQAFGTSGAAGSATGIASFSLMDSLLGNGSTTLNGPTPPSGAPSWTITDTNTGSVSFNSAASPPLSPPGPLPPPTTLNFAFTGVQFINASPTATDNFNFTTNTAGSGMAIDAGGQNTGSDTATFSSAGPRTIDMGLLLNFETINGTAGVDTLLGASNKSNSFSVTGANSGTVTVGLAYTTAFFGVENLVGGKMADNFVLGAAGGSLSGTIDDLGGGMVLNFQSKAGPVGINLSANTAGGYTIADATKVTGVVGNGVAGSSLTGLNADAVWEITNPDQGTVTYPGGNTIVDFLGFPNLTGGTGADTFLFDPTGTVSGTINGGTGTDSLNFSQILASLTFDLQNKTVNALINGGNSNAFSNIVSLVGNSPAFNTALLGTSGDDTFALTGVGAGSVAGYSFTNVTTIDGKGGNNTLSYNGYTPAAVNISVQNNSATGLNNGSANGFANIQAFVGNNQPLNSPITTTFTGPAAGSVYTFNGPTSGTIITPPSPNVAFTFSQIGVLIASNTAGNSFVFSTAGSGTGVQIFAGNGVNTADFSPQAGPVTANLQLLQGITSVIGTANTGDTLIGPNGTNVWTLTGSTSGQVNGVTYTGFENLTGGTGSDTFNLNNGITPVGSLNDLGGGMTLNFSGGPNYTSASVNLGTAGTTGQATVTQSGGNPTLTFNLADTSKVTSIIGFQTAAPAGTGTLTGRNVAGTFALAASVQSGSPFAGTITYGSQTITFSGFAALSGGTAVGDVLSYQNYVGPLTFDLDPNKDGVVTYPDILVPTPGLANLTSFEGFAGNGNPGTTFSGPGANGSNRKLDWSFTSEQAGSVAGYSFANMGKIIGSGNDNITYATATSSKNVTFNVNLNSSTIGTATTTAFSGFASLAGSADSHITTQLTGPNLPSNWVITGPKSGTVTYISGGVITFSFNNVNALVAGSSNNSFTFTTNNNAGSGLTINGGAGTSTADFSALTGPVTVNLGSFTGFKSIIGSASNADTLIGPNTTNTWNLTAGTPGAGTVAGVAFSSFENLTGGTGLDTFNLTNGTPVVGLIDDLGNGTPGQGLVLNLGSGYQSVSANLSTTGTQGVVTTTAPAATFTIADTSKLTGLIGIGTGTLTGRNATGTWALSNTTAGTGTITYGKQTIAYSGFSSLVGGTAADQLSFATFTGPIAVNLQKGTITTTSPEPQFNGTFASFGGVVGNGVNTTLTAADTANTIVVNNPDTGSIGSFTFAGVGNIVGGKANDTLQMVYNGTLTTGARGSLSGSFTDQGGVNTIDYSQYGPITVSGDTVQLPVTINLQANTATAIAGTASGFTTIVGNGVGTAGTGNGVTLVGRDDVTGAPGAGAAAVWQISGDNSGSVTYGVAPNATTYTFSRVGSLVGGANNDRFAILPAGNIDTSINGGGTAVGGRNEIILAGSRDINFNLTDTTLFAGPISLAIANIGFVNMTGGASANVFNLLGYTGAATINGGSGGVDTLIAGNYSNYELSTGQLKRGNGAFSDSALITFPAANIEQVNLVGTAAPATFDISDWVGAADSAPRRVTLNGASGKDTVIAQDGAFGTTPVTGDLFFALVNTSLTRGGLGGGNAILNGITNAVLTTGSGNDVIDATAFTGSETLYGGAGNDVLKGGTGNNILLDGGGNNQLIGNVGNDILVGGGGIDSLFGGAGNDALIPGNIFFHGVELAPSDLSTLSTAQAGWLAAQTQATSDALAAALSAVKPSAQGSILDGGPGTANAAIKPFDPTNPSPYLINIQIVTP